MVRTFWLSWSINHRFMSDSDLYLREAQLSFLHQLMLPSFLSVHTISFGFSPFWQPLNFSPLSSQLRSYSEPDTCIHSPESSLPHSLHHLSTSDVGRQAHLLFLETKRQNPRHNLKEIDIVFIDWWAVWFLRQRGSSCHGRVWVGSGLFDHTHWLWARWFFCWADRVL